MGQWTVLLIFVTLLAQGTPHGVSMDRSSNDKSHKLSTNTNTSNGHMDSSGSQPEGRANTAVKAIDKDSQVNLVLKNQNNVANIKSNLEATRMDTNAFAVGAIEDQQLGELRAETVVPTSIQEQAPLVEGQPINVIPSVQDTSSTGKFLYEYDCNKITAVKLGNREFFSLELM